MSQVAQIDIITLGSLHEAVFALSRTRTLEDFWHTVIKHVRWVVPTRRAFVFRAIGNAAHVEARLDGGRILRGIQPLLRLDDDVLCKMAKTSRPRWFRHPWRAIEASDWLRKWVAEGDVEHVLTVPLNGVKGQVGVLVLEYAKSGDEAKRGATAAIAALFGRHVGTTHDVLFSAIEVANKNRKLEETRTKLVGAVQEIHRLNATLEDRIEERTRALDEAHQDLMAMSRRAGRAEVASGVLHNVGNVLNSVNVSASVMSETIENTAGQRMESVAKLLREHATNLEGLFGDPNRGPQLSRYISLVAEELTGERTKLLSELSRLREGLDHIRVIISTQQTYSKSAGVAQTLDPKRLIEDTLRLVERSMTELGIELRIEFGGIDEVQLDRHTVMQILVNLINNAADAVADLGGAGRIDVTLARVGDERFAIRVADNGCGIEPQNLDRIFTHGFTTKVDGHGFGLHNSALAARSLGGSLSFASAGVGQGTAFTLELPIAREGPTSSELKPEVLESLPRAS